MADLYLTHTRAALLAHIGDGSIRKDPYNTEIRYEMRDTRLNLTARVAEVIRKPPGWARVENYDVVLTTRGRAVLAEYQKEHG